ncbi:MAG: VOC family protein [Candidatus Aminicenantes bacterium]|nr:MAG: VOC family protein [Candidatus Aminicenantes bacterium]
MNLEIDHVFCFVDPGIKELEKLVKKGFKANISRIHKGQGTANRCVVFKKNYLELIYLTSIEEAKANPLKLHIRALWQETGACPFGIGLRGHVSKKERKLFREYKPKDLPKGEILIYKESMKKPYYPLFFIVPSKERLEDHWPVNNHSIPKEELENKFRVSAIETVEITGPKIEPVPLIENIPGITLGKEENYFMKIGLNGDWQDSIHINSLLSFTVVNY